MARNQLIFISGGVRSGKSSFAELYASQIAESHHKELYYLATSIGFDYEMTKRIEKHKLTRKNSKQDWKTIEASTDLAGAIEEKHKASVILLDCLTVWLNNVFYNQDITEETTVNSNKWFEVKEYMLKQIEILNNEIDTLIIVSNDIFHDEINQTSYVNLYSQMLGEIHQLIVSKANQAFAIESSIPILMK